MDSLTRLQLMDLANRMHAADSAYQEAKRAYHTALVESAKFKVGDVVLWDGKRFTITRVFVQYGDKVGYQGAEFKKDGTPSARRRELYSYRPITRA